MRLLLIGAPGSGKGTQAELLAQRLGITHISSGELLREHIDAQTDLGRQVSEYVEAGDLVPDALVMDMLFRPVVNAAEAGGYVLDGFPRTVEQALAAYDVARTHGAHVQAAVHLEVPDDELMQRILSRSRGSDDSREVIEHRLEVYRDKTVPLLGYYRQRAWLASVDGSRDVDAVHADIVERVTDLRSAAGT
ncbi:MAG: adenylate kinase [Actinomycetota bacterium]|jgi:adenylate kinase|nr:adenylate kinase [Actinomycetota bacterium]